MRGPSPELIRPTDEDIAFIASISPESVVDLQPAQPDSGPIETSRIRKLSFDGLRRTYTPKVRTKEKRYDVATIDNSWGLPAGTSCPGATPFCQDCYGKAAEEWDPVRLKMERNMDRLVSAETPGRMLDVLAPGVAQWRKRVDRHGGKKSQLIFRPHWNGDIYNENYAEALAALMQFEENQDVSWWIFTRSYGWGENPVDVIPILAGISNLALYLSVDWFNKDRADEVKSEYGDLVHAAYCGETTVDTMNLSGGEGFICPETAGEMELMPPKARNNPDGNRTQGACTVCRKCIRGETDVHFITGTTTGEVEQPRIFPKALGGKRQPRPQPSMPAEPVPDGRLFSDQSDIPTQESFL